MIDIIPAIDLMNGKCVRLSQGSFSRKTTYSDDPADVAMSFEAAGLTRLHIVDLDGAKTGKIANLGVLKKIASATKLKIDFGGGINGSDDLEKIFDAGASMANVGSIAVKEPDKFLDLIERFGGEKILLGADVRDGRLFVDGWQTATSLEVIPFLLAQYTRGVRKVFVTDIAKDGLLLGTSIELYRRIREAIPDMELIASGGISCMADIDDLEQIGCAAVIVGKAIYEGKITAGELAGQRR